MIRENNHGHGVPPHGSGPGTDGAAVPVDMRPAPPQPMPPKPVEAQSIDPKALWRAFQRRWFLATSLGLIFGGIAAAVAFVVTPAPFTAFAEVRISSVQERILFKTADERAAFETFKQSQLIQMKNPFVLSAALSDPEIQKLSLVREQEDAVDWLDEELRVQSVATEFIRLSLSGEQPQELAAVVNAVTNSYLKDTVDGLQQERVKRLESLEKIQREKEEDLRTKHKTLQDYATSLQTANSSQANARVDFLLQMHLELRRQLSQVYFQLLKAKSQLDFRQGTNKESQVEFPEAALDVLIAQEPRYRQLEEQISASESKLANMRSVLKDKQNDPRILADKKLVDQRRKELTALREELRPMVTERLKSEMASESAASDAQLRTHIAELEAEYARLEKEMETTKQEEKNTGLMSFKMESIDKEIAQNEAIAKTIGDEIERLRIELPTGVGIKLYRPAEVPAMRDTSKKYRMSGMAGFALFGLFAGGIVWLEYLSKRISSTEEVANELSLRIVGSLPTMPRAVMQGRAERNRARNAYWLSLLTESVDATRTIILNDAKLEAMNSVMVCSATGSEGKTTLSCHLATSVARTGRSVLLLDADIRRPSVHKVFEISNSKGLCDVLRGTATLQDITHSVGLGALSVIPGGKVNQEALRALARDGMAPLLEELKRSFDFVIVDSSPVLPVTDALLVAPHVDGVVFSIRRYVSRISKVAAACQRLSMLGVPILGAVAIGLDDGTAGFHYPYRYGYGYGHAYHMHPQA